MANLGKVKATVSVGGDAPGLDLSKWYSAHDLPASGAYDYYLKGTEKQASNVEFITDTMNGGKMVVPLRRFKQVANYIDGMSSSATLANPHVIWNVLTSSGGNVAGVIGGGTYIKNMITNTSQEMLAPSSGSTKYPSYYTGPRWDIPRGPKTIVPDSTGTPPETGTPGTGAASTTADDFSAATIAQEAICENIWWAIETTSLSGNAIGTPFWLDISLKQPSASKQPTFFAMRVGDSGSAGSGSGTSQECDLIDLVFTEGSGVRLFDWGVPVVDGNGASEPTKVDLSISNITWGGANRIGFFPIAGRLCIKVNGQDFLYTRIKPATTGDDGDNNGGATLFWPSYSKIKLIGSNSQAVISMGSMTFDKVAKLPTPMPGGFDPQTNAATLPLRGSTDGFDDGSGGGGDGGEGGSDMLELPGGRNGESGIVLGAYASNVTGDDAWSTLSNGKRYGTVTLELEDNISGSVSGGTTNKHYVVVLESETSEFAEGGGAEGGDGEEDGAADYVLCPAFFRMRGITSGDTGFSGPSGEPEDIDDDIMEISESFSSPDRHHIVHSVDITLYNEGGAHDGLLEASYPIQLAYSWEGEGGGSSMSGNFFTGVIMHGAKSLMAGKETLTLHCEDYMSILEATLIMNSPYYDGMDAFFVIQDLAAKAGVTVEDNTGGDAGERVFLPAGYSFLEPVKWFDAQQNVKECILDIASFAGRVVYFDGDGTMQFTEMQGGAGFDSSGITVANEYFSDPTSADDTSIVIDEVRREIKLNSVVNQIYVKSIDRTTRMQILHGDKAEDNENILSYRKVMFLQLPVLGTYDAVQDYVEKLKQRVYKPIRGITIKTVDDSYVLPMTFMSVDGEKYRVMSVNRTIRAEDNSVVTTVSGEWVGAVDSG